MQNVYETGSWFPNLGPMILDFTKMKLGADQHNEDRVLRERALDMEGRRLEADYGIIPGASLSPVTKEMPPATLVSPGNTPASPPQFGGYKGAELVVQQGNLAVNQGTQALNTEKFQTENPQAQPWNTSNFMRLNSKLKLAGIPVDDIPFMNDLKTFAADPTMKRGDVAQAVEMKWPEWAAQTADSLTQKVSKLSEQAANLPENDPKRAEIMKQVEKTIKAQQLLESIPADKIKQTLFPDVYQYEQKQKQISSDQVKAAAMDKVLRGGASEDERVLAGIAPKVANQQRKTREFEKDGKTWGQDYDFNPTDQTETLVGKPYVKSTPKPGADGKLSDIEKQELIGVRADLRTVNRELLEVRRNAGFGMEAAKGRLPLIEAEYNDLKAREKELLTKDTGSAPTTPAAKPKVNAEALLQEANQAIARGADPAKVKKRLKDQYGITVK